MHALSMFMMKGQVLTPPWKGEVGGGLAGAPPPSLVSRFSGDLVVISFIRGEAGRSCDNNNKQTHMNDLFVQNGAAVDYSQGSQTSKQAYPA